MSKDILTLAREAGAGEPESLYGRTDYVVMTKFELERFAELVRADERWLSSQRRGVLMFNPYTGTPRHPSDVASDPHGILMLDPEQPIRAARSKNEDRN